MVMLTRSLMAAVMVFALSGMASAACFADYKAKQDNPLRLHYGVVELRGPCSANAAAQEIAPRIARDGWQLLNVVSVFDETGLNERQQSAGQYFLRY